MPLSPRSSLRALALAAGLGLVSAARAQPDPIAPAAELVRQHDDEGALRAIAALPRPIREGPRARYLRGRLLERLGRHAEAAEAFPLDAPALPDAVRADSQQRAAIALARSGRCDRARERLAGDTSPVAEARAAQCALAAGDLTRAVEALRAVVRRGHAAVDLFAARFALAEALTRSGQRDEAISVLTRLILERPEHPEVARAEEALTALNGGPVTLDFEQRMDRVDHLVDARRYDDALRELEAIGRPRDPAALRRYLHTKGMALFRERHHYAEAAVVLAESARLRGAHAEEDRFHAARALSRADRDMEAVRAYRAFARAHAGHRRAPEALYLAAWLEIRHGVRSGEREMRRFLASRHARAAPSLAREATWQLALRAFERGRHRQAAPLFERYAAMDEGALVRARGLYWLGRARQARGDRRGAIAAYRDALYVEPLHWYALLARQRLEALGETAPPPFPDPPEAGSAAAPSVTLPEETRFYAALGLDLDAREALRAHEDALRRDGPHALAEAYRRLGAPSRLYRLFGGAATTSRRARPGPADRWRWDAAYPRPWEARVLAAAEAVELTPAHLYAVMRQESGFNPDAVSYADAVGLMQLLPSTAARVAEGLGLRLEREMLFDPAVNVRLGATYVGGLARRFGVPLAFAAFNAGGHNVQRWLEASGRIELDLFVEHIPFEQTRNYIRRVTTHLAHYQYLEDPERGWPLTLPTHVEP